MLGRARVSKIGTPSKESERLETFGNTVPFGSPDANQAIKDTPAFHNLG